MSVRRIAEVQPELFAFTKENRSWAEDTIKKYPSGKQMSAVIPLLWRAQEQAGGWLPEPAMRHVGEMLGMAPMRVYEVATFYTMFNLEPVGKFHVQLCGTTPCWLRGADGLKEVCRRMIGEQHHVTRDGVFSWVEVECLAACVNAPMVQINKDYYEDLTPDSFEQILNDLKAGKHVEPGPQVDRQLSAPIGGPTTLLDGSGKPETRGTLSDAHKPKGLKKAREGKGDDLTRITGISPSVAQQLQKLGIYHYDQIASWTPENVAWVETYLRYQGRIPREGWIEQAGRFAEQEAE